MAKLIEEKIKTEDESLFDTIDELVHIKDEDDNLVGSWCFASEAETDGKSEQEIVDFALDNGFKVFKVFANEEIEEGKIIAASDITKEDIQKGYKEFFDMEPEVEEVKKEKEEVKEALNESFHARALKEQQLKENTANFHTQQDFDIYAISDKEFVGFDDWEKEEQEEYENGNYSYFEILFQDNYDELIKFAEELSDELKFFNITLKGGYFDGLQTYVYPKCNANSGRDFEYDDIDSAIYEESSDLQYYDGLSEEEADKKAEEAVKAEIEKINKEVLPHFKDYGFYKLQRVGTFSSGETIYQKAEECLKEDVDQPKFEAGKLDANGQVIESEAKFFNDEEKAIKFAIENDFDYVTEYTYDEGEELPKSSSSVWSKAVEETDKKIEGLEEAITEEKSEEAKNTADRFADKAGGLMTTTAKVFYGDNEKKQATGDEEPVKEDASEEAGESSNDKSASTEKETVADKFANGMIKAGGALRHTFYGKQEEAITEDRAERKAKADAEYDAAYAETSAQLTNLKNKIVQGVKNFFKDDAVKEAVDSEATEPEETKKVLERELDKDTKEFVMYHLFGEEEDLKKAADNIDKVWKITNDKSLDPVRNEEDDKAWPWVLLIDGKFVDSLSADFGDRVFGASLKEGKGNGKRRKVNRMSPAFFPGYEPVNSDGSKSEHGFDSGCADCAGSAE